jgi:hypothetical protein
VNEDKCDAAYCREPVELTLELKDKTLVRLCVDHWTEHCDDKPIKLRGGKVLEPVIFNATGKVELVQLPRVI